MSLFKRAGLLFRSIFFTFLFPGTITLLIPYWLISSGSSAISSHLRALRYAGVPLILIGAAGILWCIWEFFSRGKGTLAPVEPPKLLVIDGLYKYVRNPMYVGVLTILIGEAIFFLSLSVLIEAVIFFVSVQVFLGCYEEPLLGRQFGKSV